MSSSPVILNQLISTLQHQNHSKTNQIASLTQHLNQLLFHNSQLIQREQTLTFHNTSHVITIEKLNLQLNRAHEIIRQIEGELTRKHYEIQGLRGEFDEAVRRLMMAEDRERERERQVQGMSYDVNERLREEREYERLNTRNFFDNNEIGQIKQGLERYEEEQKVAERHQQLVSKLNQSEMTIIDLTSQVETMKQQVQQLRTEREELQLSVASQAGKLEMEMEQLESRLKHSQQSVIVSRSQNEVLTIEVKQLVEIRYNLQIQINTFIMNNERLNKQLVEYKEKNVELKQLLGRSQSQLETQREDWKRVKHLRDNQVALLEQERQRLLTEGSKLKDQVCSILQCKIDIGEYDSLKREYQEFKIQHERILQQLQLKESHLLSKVYECSHLQNRDQEHTRNYREEISNLISINHTLSNELTLVRERLVEEQTKNKQILRLQRANRSLLQRVEVLETSIHEKRRKSSTRIDSLLHVPSVQTIPSMDKIPYTSSRVMNSRSNLLRMRSEENLMPKIWGPQPHSREKEPKGSSRVKNIFGSGVERVDPNAAEKLKWKSLQDRIESLKYQNLDLKKHMEINNL